MAAAALVAVTLLAVLAIGALAVVARRALRALAQAEDQLGQHRWAAVAELEAAGRDAGDRLDRAVARAETAVAVAETAARVAEAALTAPAVKVRAWGAGSAAAARTFRDRRALRSGSD